MSRTARIVIVGAGVTGCSIAFHLAAQGWRDILLIDQGPFPWTGGSTSHSPGTLFQTGPSPLLASCARYTADLFRELAAEGERAFLPVGGIELATTRVRHRDLKRRLGFARSWGVEGARLVDPDEIAALAPLIDPGRIVGGLYVPGDGIANGVRAAAAIVARLEADGVGAVWSGTEVTGFDMGHGRLRGLFTTRGTVTTGAVVLAAGVWGPRLARLAGLSMPLMPVDHQFLRTEPLPELSAGRHADATLPVLRHADLGVSIRQWQDSLVIGNHRRPPRLFEPETLRRPGEAADMPSVVDFTPGDTREALAGCVALMPALAERGLAHSANGLVAVTPDGMPILGETSISGLWMAAAVWGAHAGGVGRLMADWIAKGEPDGAMHAADLARFHPMHHVRAFVRERAAQRYRSLYEMPHPVEQTPPRAPRPLRRLPLHARHARLDAVFAEAAGWSRPQWYGTSPLTGGGEAAFGRDDWSARGWSARQGGEHLGARARGGLFDLSWRMRIEVAGRGAARFLQWVCTVDIDVPSGTAVDTALVNRAGGLVALATVMRLAPDRFLVLGGIDRHLLVWLERLLPRDGSVYLSDVTSGAAVLGLTGPAAGAALEAVCPDDHIAEAAWPDGMLATIAVGHVPVLAARHSAIGEPGWELHVASEFADALWEALAPAIGQEGIVPIGYGAWDSLRLENGVRLWGLDVTAEHMPDEAGLRALVHLDRGDFLGRQALMRVADLGVRRRLCAVQLEPGGRVPLGAEPVWADGRVVGHVTSGNFGYSIGRAIAYAWLPIDYAHAGTRVEIEYFGELQPATVAPDPLHDRALAPRRSRRSAGRRAGGRGDARSRFSGGTG